MKRTSLRKQRKSSRASLVRKLDKLVSEYVRKRDGKCVICGSTTQLGAGHIFSRRSYSTRWDIHEGNVWAQCWKCNFKHTHDPYPYYNWFIKKYGQHNFDVLYEQWSTVVKYSNSELDAMASGLESLLNEG